jgi:uncharacterized membrane protein YbhN (UPF0104 family)
MNRVSGPAIGHGARVGMLAVPLLLYLVFRNVDATATLALIESVGPSAALLLLPSLAGALIETWAFRGTLRLLGFDPAYGLLFRIRVATEALSAILPLGALWAEAARPTLLAREGGPPIATGLAAGVGRKYLLGISQAAYLGLGFVLGRHALEAGFERLGVSRHLALTALVMAVVLFGLAELAAHTLRGGRTMERILTLLRRIPIASLGRVLEGVAASSRNTDGALRALFGTPSLRILAAPCLASWFTEALETWAILHAVGVPIGLGEALGVETLVVLARQILVFVPGGLGVLELGYAAFLVGPGLASLPACAAFVLLKRTKELVWLVIGTGAWVHARGRIRVPAVPSLVPG